MCLSSSAWSVWTSAEAWLCPAAPFALFTALVPLGIHGIPTWKGLASEAVGTWLHRAYRLVPGGKVASSLCAAAVWPWLWGQPCGSAFLKAVCAICPISMVRSCLSQPRSARG